MAMILHSDYAQYKQIAHTLLCAINDGFTFGVAFRLFEQKSKFYRKWPVMQGVLCTWGTQ